MTQAWHAGSRIHPIQMELMALGRQRRAYAFAAGAVRVLWICLAAALAVVIVDAATALSGEARLTVLALLAVMLLIGLVLSVRWRVQAERESLGDARAVEQRYRLWHNPLINALFLGGIAESATENNLTTALAKRSIQRGQSVLEQVNAQAIIDRQALKREGGWLWTVMVAWLVLVMIQPQLVLMGMQRLINPMGLHMPFSLTQLQVTVSPSEVYEGDDVIISAVVSGRIPPKAELVELDDAGEVVQRWRMRPGSATMLGETAERGDMFHIGLYDMREPMTLRVQAGGARSAPFTIVPQPRPAEPVTSDESRQGDVSEEDEPLVDGQLMSEDQIEEEEQEPSLAELFPDLFEQIDGLSDMAFDIGSRAQELFANMPSDLDSPEGRQWLEDMAALDADLEAFRQRAMELAQEARRLAAENPEHAEELEELARQLEQLGLCSLGNCPGLGEGECEQCEGPCTGQCDGQGQGTGEGRGIGQGGGGAASFFSRSGYWLMGAQQAGVVDASMLTQIMMQLQRPRTTRLSDGSSQMRDRPVAAPGGTYRHQVGRDTQDDFAAPDAVMQQVPPAYRELVRHYYERVQQDETSGRPSP